MRVRMVGSTDSSDVRVEPVVFEGACDVRGVVPPGVPEVEERLVCARLRCQKGGPERTGNDCLACGRYRGWNDGPGESEVRIRCAWSALAPVWQRMTLAPAMLTVPPDLSCDDAGARARQNGVRHIVVALGRQLMGVVCRCDLHGSAPEMPVGALVAPEVFAIRADASLGEAAGAMAQLEIGCLPVLDDGDLAGVITRGDLRRVGAPEPQLGARYCASCGSPHGVRANDNGVDTCLDCLDLYDELMDPRTFGEGG